MQTDVVVQTAAAQFEWIAFARSDPDILSILSDEPSSCPAAPHPVMQVSVEECHVGLQHQDMLYYRST